jgi:hypothetical protein
MLLGSAQAGWPMTKKHNPGATSSLSNRTPWARSLLRPTATRPTALGRCWPPVPSSRRHTRHMPVPLLLPPHGVGPPPPP